jgi:O-antigen/teichoic acid export membrane protein
MSLTHRAIHAFKWSVLGEVASRAVGPLVFIVLARLLVPEDFGVVAAAMVIISFSQVFTDAGLGKALIQRQNRVEESANVVFWLNLGIGLVIVAILIAAAPLIADFFHDERIAPIIRVLSLQILLAAFSSVHTALLQRDLDFKPLFWVRLVTTAVPSLASIPLAIYGMGYWALVAGTLIGQVVQSAVFWMISPWRPQWGLDCGLTRELIAFGKWAMLSGLLGWFYGWMDAIVVGHYLGSHDMGLYRTGCMFVTMVFGLIFPPLLPVLYSLFSRAQYDLPKLREALVMVAHVIALTALPIGFFLFVLRDEIADMLFGIPWQGVNQVIGFIALMQSLSWVVGANGEVYRAIGKPHVDTWANTIMLLIYSTGYLVSVQFGLQIFLEMRLGLGLLAMIAHIGVAKRILGVPIIKWFYAGPLVASIASVILFNLFDLCTVAAWLKLIITFVVFAAVSILFAVILERPFFLKLREIVRPSSH